MEMGVNPVSPDTPLVEMMQCTAGVSCSPDENAGVYIIGRRVDFRRLSASRATDGVVEGPPFAPAAERWVLI
jgi:hypothetical protein